MRTEAIPADVRELVEKVRRHRIKYNALMKAQGQLSEPGKDGGYDECPGDDLELIRQCCKGALDISQNEIEDLEDHKELKLYLCSQHMRRLGVYRRYVMNKLQIKPENFGLKEALEFFVRTELDIWLKDHATEEQISEWLREEDEKPQA